MYLFLLAISKPKYLNVVQITYWSINFWRFAKKCRSTKEKNLNQQNLSLCFSVRKKITFWSNDFWRFGQVTITYLKMTPRKKNSESSTSFALFCQKRNCQKDSHFDLLIFDNLGKLQSLVKKCRSTKENKKSESAKSFA